MPQLTWINHYAVTPDLPGGTRHVELGRELVRLGWDVTILSADFHFQERRYVRRHDAQDTAPIEEMVDGVRFLWLWSAPYQRNDWRRGANWVSFARQVRRVDRPTDLVVGSSPHLFAAWSGAGLARRARAPFVLEVRDLWPESLLAAAGRRGATYYALDALARMLYRRARLVVVLTDGVAKALTSRGMESERFILAPNGVDPAAFGGTRREPGGPVTFVYAGAHGPANGLDILVDAADRLRSRPDIRIVSVGDGPAKGRLAKLIREKGVTNIELRPPIPKSAVPALLAQADAGLMLLRSAELFSFGVSPNKLFDYLAASLPVVSNVKGEVAEMVRLAGAGETVAPGSAEELAAAMVRMAERPAAERAALGAAGRAWVLEHHGRPAVASRLDQAFRTLVERR